MNDNIIVYESCRNLRALGRQALSGKWKLAALGTLLYVVLVMIPVIILDWIFGDGEPTAVSTIYSLLVTGPMTLGYITFALSLFRSRETSPAEVLYGFERFGKALGLYLLMSVLILLWTLLFIIPGIIAAYRYSMSFFILADNPDIGIMEAINESKRMMRGNKLKLFCLELSFIGWILLCIPTLGIGFIWLLPYMTVSITAFYDIANGSLRRKERRFGVEDGPAYRGEAIEAPGPDTEDRGNSGAEDQAEDH
jgi:uncharacterized membrane protein